jgi:zinc protease
MEERRMRTEDSPDGLLAEEVMGTAFAAHPYRWPVIGWMEDIARINATELRAFYDLYYRPNNAVLVVVGDVRPPELLARIPNALRPHPAGAGAAAGHRGGAHTARGAAGHAAERGPRACPR